MITLQFAALHVIPGTSSSLQRLSPSVSVGFSRSKYLLLGQGAPSRPFHTALLHSRLTPASPCTLTPRPVGTLDHAPILHALITTMHNTSSQDALSSRARMQCRDATTQRAQLPPKSTRPRPCRKSAHVQNAGVRMTPPPRHAHTVPTYSADTTYTVHPARNICGRPALLPRTADTSSAARQNASAQSSPTRKWASTQHQYRCIAPSSTCPSPPVTAQPPSRLGDALAL